MDPLVFQRLLSFDAASYGIATLMESFTHELMIKSLQAKVLPYAAWYTQEDIVKTIAGGSMI
jgi:hypothetical protein